MLQLADEEIIRSQVKGEIRASLRKARFVGSVRQPLFEKICHGDVVTNFIGRAGVEDDIRGEMEIHSGHLEEIRINEVVGESFEVFDECREAPEP